MRFNVLFLLLLFLIPCTFASTYTATSEKACSGNTCTVTLYSGTQFVEEGDVWVPVEHAKSLKGKGFYALYESTDPNYNVDVLDFNYTSITLSLSVSDSNLNKNVPLTIYKPKSDGYIKTKEKSIKLKSKSDFNVSTFDFSLDSKLKFGSNSTNVTLSGNQSGAADVYIDEATPNINYGSTNSMFIQDPFNNRSAFMKFNVSFLNSSTNVTNSFLRLMIASNTLDVGDIINISVHNYYRTDWNETNVTWNTSSVSVGDFNSTPSDYHNFTNTDTGVRYFNTTSILRSSTHNSTSFSGNVSFYILAVKKAGNIITSDMVTFASKEHTTPTYPPFLNVTYEYSPPLDEGPGAGGSPYDTITASLMGGGSLRETLITWNPEIYILLEEKIKHLLSGTNLNTFIEDLFQTFVLLVKYIFKQPASLVPQGDTE